MSILNSSWDLPLHVDPPGNLVLVRHGESVSVAKNCFCMPARFEDGGDEDVLTLKGIWQSKALAQELLARGYCFNAVYSSPRIRARQSAEILLEGLGQPGLETRYSEAISDHRFGILAGLNKEEARKQWGHEQVNMWHLSYEV
jgi:2,3-bisphosphoglycerate-dependent phosphoglycerate mutase